MRRVVFVESYMFVIKITEVFERAVYVRMLVSLAWWKLVATVYVRMLVSLAWAWWKLVATVCGVCVYSVHIKFPK